jgi:4-amino-4-deoxy-L-arabinose transferase-like glycosyltransferase
VRNGHAIWVVLVLYLLVAISYSVITPVMEASDELWHYPMVKYIADHGTLPVQEPGVVTPWRQEGSQPPLYYALGALLTFWINTSDLNQVRHVNPHADSGIVRSDGNTNLIVHTFGERFPWRGTVLAIHVVRLMSVLMGAGTVYLTYLLALTLWPGRVGLGLVAASITAFNPMFCFITGSVNNDNLAMLLGGAGIWLLVRLVHVHAPPQDSQPRRWWRDVLVTGTVLGLALLTKPSTGGLLLLTALSVSYVAWRRRSWWHWLSGGTATAGLVVLIAGWWFARNAILYDGDWLGIERFILILGYREPPATLRQLWGEREGFMMAFWGLFGGVNLPLPGWIYRVLNGSALAAAVGLGGRALDRVVASLRRSSSAWPRPVLEPHSVGIALTMLWPIVVFIPWLTWATRTWSSQGRLVFTAMSAWSIWLALGLSSLLPGRWSLALPAGCAVLMLAVAGWAPWGLIAPSYRPPLLSIDDPSVPQHSLVADVGGQLRLLGYDLVSRSARPGEAFRFSLHWEVRRPTERDWSVFVHVLDHETGLPAATRDRYPGQGLLATSDLEPGSRWVDRYVVELPRTAYAPSTAMLEVGLYDARTGERASIRVDGQPSVGIVDNALRFQPLAIEPWPGPYPNPLHINFGDQMLLVGWDLNRRVAAPGDELNVVLYWRCIGRIPTDYTVFAHVVGEQDRKWAQHDGWPAGMATSTWSVDQEIEDRHDLLLSRDAPAGGKRLIIGVYSPEPDGGLRRLRIIDAQGRVLPEVTVTLDRVRLTEATR